MRRNIIAKFNPPHADLPLTSKNATEQFPNYSSLGKYKVGFRNWHGNTLEYFTQYLYGTQLMRTVLSEYSKANYQPT